MSIVRQFINLGLMLTFLTCPSAAFCQVQDAMNFGDSPIIKARVVALSSSIFTRMPVYEEYLNKYGCQFEASSPEKIDELKSILLSTVRPDASDSAPHTNLRTAIYLYGVDGLERRYVFNSSGSSGRINGTLMKNSGSVPIVAEKDLIEDIRHWAGPDNPWQKFSDTCLK